MSSIKRLSPDDIEALRTGRAIPFLLNHRVAELPSHTLTVIASIDTEQFRGYLVSDDRPDEKLSAVHLPLPSVAIDDSVRLESKDAAAIHRLWQQWSGGVRDSYLCFVRQIAIAEEAVSLTDLLASQDPEADRDSGDVPPPPDKPPRQRSKAKKTARKKKGRRS